MTTWFAKSAWLGGHHLSHDVSIEVESGHITSISSGGESVGTPLDGVLIPGFVNAHSHAFHRLLRGRTHDTEGDFWQWRSMMFDVAGRLSPETYEELATAVYIEMAMAGITSVGEFHYLHHQRGGVAYDDANEMAHALVRAARNAGIRISILDAGYFKAGFGNESLHPVQERFRDPSGADWISRVAALDDEYTDTEDVTVGVAPHSVRAVPADILSQIARWDHGLPIHIHVSEQPMENDDCVAATGMTPTELLAVNDVLTQSTTLVHATHLTESDVAAVGSAGSGVCYCATTERDLADGLGPSGDLDQAGVSLSVGTDSHAMIDMFSEARGIELHNRLRTGKRGQFGAAALIEAATVGGSSAIGFGSRGLAVGEPADFVVIDTTSPRLAGSSADSLIDMVVFAATADDVKDVFVAGDRIVIDGVHTRWDEARSILDRWWV